MDKKQRIGTYIKSSVTMGEIYEAYVPAPLPPNPPLLAQELYPLLDQANTALGRLDGISILLPDPSLFLYMYVRKEAVLSSQIEGTQSTLSDLLLFENNQKPSVGIDDVEEVSSYVSAMMYGLQRLKDLPLSLRLIREIHGKLMHNARGNHKNPGEFRTSQNWIGGTRPGNARFVPPPADRLMECLDAFEKFLHDDMLKLPSLVKAALAHVQFETIHPFLDGNGRLGRLLITLMLHVDGMIKEPLLYLSFYFKSYREDYYNHLQLVRETGDWEGWVQFFLKGVVETSNQAVETAQLILALFQRDRHLVESSEGSTASTLMVYSHLQKNPITNTQKIMKSCPISLPTTLRVLQALRKLGVVQEITGKERNKIFLYKEYLSIIG